MSNVQKACNVVCVEYAIGEQRIGEYGWRSCCRESKDLKWLCHCVIM